jgi:hypothetical protein
MMFLNDWWITTLKKIKLLEVQPLYARAPTRSPT